MKRLLFLLLFATRTLAAVAADLSHEESAKTATDPLLAVAAAAVPAGNCQPAAAVQAGVKEPQPGPIQLATPVEGAKSSREIAALARSAHLRLGWYFRCAKCDQMHLNLAGAYPIATDVVATAHHVLAPPSTMKEGWLILLDAKNLAHAVTTVLVANAAQDCALLRVAAGGLTPLALRGTIEQGEPAYCFSDPLGNRSYFSAGIVNRLYVRNSPGEPGLQRLNVSTDWAQGSSGSAILDERGNAIGHVARIQTYPRASGAAAGTPQPMGTTLVLHEAIPTAVILGLVEGANGGQ